MYDIKTTIVIMTDVWH